MRDRHCQREGQGPQVILNVDVSVEGLAVRASFLVYMSVSEVFGARVHVRIKMCAFECESELIALLLCSGMSHWLGQVCVECVFTPKPA